MLSDCELLDGFHSPEQDELGFFIWTTGRFAIRLPRTAHFAELQICYYGDSGSLTIDTPAGTVDQVELCRGWHRAMVRLGDARTGDVIGCTITPVIPVTGETRKLGLMLRSIELTSDERRYEMTTGSARNLRLNQQELAAGTVVMQSVPPLVRTSSETRCNIPETSKACVYCAWDWAKLSKRGAPRFGLDTLEQMGEFYRGAAEVVDCSIGEPTMNRQFGAIAAQIDRDGKAYSFTSNGQLLSPKRRQEMLGKQLRLYVSIDSATAAGYARYRNDRFDDIIANLTALCREKKQHQDLPRVYVSFILMRSNIAELPAYFALMSRVGVDEIKLRMLYLDENLPLVNHNNGYRFDYGQELLTMDELAAAGLQARQLAREHGVDVYVESEQFANDASRSGEPLCSEPWRTLYMLNRGIMPCCYATEPIATWDEQQGRPLNEFLRDVFNGPAYQEIRRELAEGRMSDYCRRTPSCPILKQMHHRGTIDAPQNSLQQQMFADQAAGTAEPLPTVSRQSLADSLKRVA